MINPEDKLRVLMNDPHYLEAIKWAFNVIIESNKPVNNSGSNELLGAKYRAYLEGRDITDQCIKKIESYKNSPKVSSNFDKSK